ncbi:hypothetical protein [uncultured Thiohalocapsa sp.]|uniref:hypothetical protein n=1 Tax=uncultured Thiohalocapsa sp. TaxID=768990 RepID=UPI0025EF9568|nr:hypothetical protein [uncultured Thiohalocapsa sp.]
MKTSTNLLLSLLAAVIFAAGGVLASPDDDHGGGGSDDDDHGGGRGSREALSTDFIPIPPTKGKGDGQYFDLRGGSIDTVLNANVRIALEKLDADGNTVAVLNTHLGINVDNYSDALVTLFIGTDEDGDGTCLTEGPTSICVLDTGGSDDLEVNPDGILHAAWAIALREEDDRLLGSGRCWSDFEEVTVIPQLDEYGNMTSVVFEIEGGEPAMPEIGEDDGTMVGFSAPWLPLLEDMACTGDTVCEVVPIMMGIWDD